MCTHYFIQTPPSLYPTIFSEEKYRARRAEAYSERNYGRPGPVSWIKTRHFEAALRLTREQFHRCTVIDFGCADGIFLPSLARHFPHVVGIDTYPLFCEVSSQVVSRLGLANVTVLCSKGLTVAEVASRLPIPSPPTFCSC